MKPRLDVGYVASFLSIVLCFLGLTAPEGGARGTSRPVPVEASSYQLDSLRLNPRLRDRALTPYLADRLSNLFVRYGRQAQIPPTLLAAVVSRESAFDSLAYNPEDPSWGLGQVMPRFWRHVFSDQCGPATRETLLRADVAVCHTAYILGSLLRAHSPDTARAIRAYNNGEGSESGYDDLVLAEWELLGQGGT